MPGKISGLPSENTVARYSQALVFTDADYWRSVAFPSSFMNLTMGMALHDSHCVFIGLSMTDINILRWLANRFNEICSDERVRRLNYGHIESIVSNSPAVRWRLNWHYWIRPRNNPSVRFLSEFHATRGVSSVEIDSWSDSSFQKLFEECFGSLTF